MGFTTKELTTLLEAHKMPCAPIQSIREVMEDPQVKARGSIVEFDYPGIGAYPTAAFTPKFSTLETVLKRAPRLGEDNEAVYCGLLGYSRERFETLGKEGVI